LVVVDLAVLLPRYLRLGLIRFDVTPFLEKVPAASGIGQHNIRTLLKRILRWVLDHNIADYVTAVEDRKRASRATDGGKACSSEAARRWHPPHVMMSGKYSCEVSRRIQEAAADVNVNLLQST
jgi:hypothetical protein